MKPTGEVVYLVDDDPKVREALSELFASINIPHVAFATAAEYLSYERSDTCACLVLDVQMPDISGLDLQQRLRDGDSPPIIFISGYGDVPSTVRAMKGGAIEFLTKPVNPEALAAAIRVAFTKDLVQRQMRAELFSLQRRFALLTPR
jgi:FixJ family two-component response regulator